MASRSRNKKGDDPEQRGYLVRFGERVRRVREQRRITLRQLAELSGLSARFIIEVEKGAGNPSLGSLVRLSRSLDSPLSTLLPAKEFGDGAPPDPAVQEILKLCENRPREQVARALSCVAAFLKESRGSHVALVGMRGAGKTTVGKLLSRRLNAPFYEFDELVEKEAGLTLAEIFDLQGEPYYRALEERIAEKTLRRAPGVIAAGGGFVTNPTNLLRLKLHSFVVWLKASPEELIERVRSEHDERPLRSQQNALKQLKEILERRMPYYAQADLVVQTSGKSPESICRQIFEAFYGQRKVSRPKQVVRN